MNFIINSNLILITPDNIQISFLKVLFFFLQTLYHFLYPCGFSIIFPYPEAIGSMTKLSFFWNKNISILYTFSHLQHIS